MPYESPYQSMVENEVLFQQQPWLKRIPHQIRHAVRPVEDALTGAGAGVVAGTALGSPRAGAVVGGVLGGLHGVLSRTPTAAQEWAFNNPELVHVLKARAAYDAGDGFEMGKGASWEKLAVSPEWVGARLESLKDSTDPAVAARLSTLHDRTDSAANRVARESSKVLDNLPTADISLTRILQLADEGHPDANRYLHLDQQEGRLQNINRGPITRAINRIDANRAGDARAAATPKAPAPATHAPAAAPKSNLRRNLGIGAAAVAIPTLAYTAYRHFADKPDAEKAREAGKTAMLRTLGF